MYSSSHDKFPIRKPLRNDCLAIGMELLDGYGT